jgi:hypothetical protein
MAVVANCKMQHQLRGQRGARCVNMRLKEEVMAAAVACDGEDQKRARLSREAN